MVGSVHFSSSAVRQTVRQGKAKMIGSACFGNAKRSVHHYHPKIINDFSTTIDLILVHANMLFKFLLTACFILDAITL